MYVYLLEKATPQKKSVRDLQPGQVGSGTVSGEFYLKLNHGAINLNTGYYSEEGLYNCEVNLLPAGTKVVLETK